MHYAKVFSNLLDSSAWCSGDDDLRIIWLTMLLMADQDGVVHARAPGIATRAIKPLEATERVLELLQQPDPHSRTPDNEGRRVAAVRQGYKLLNYEYYKSLLTAEHRRKLAAERQARRRAKESVTERDRGVTERDSPTSTSTSNFKSKKPAARDPATPTVQSEAAAMERVRTSSAPSEPEPPPYPERATCPKCGMELQLRLSKHGWFYTHPRWMDGVCPFKCGGEEYGTACKALGRVGKNEARPLCSKCGRHVPPQGQKVCIPCQHEPER